MKHYVVTSVLALSLTSFATFAQAQGGDESMNRLLESLQQVRTMMYNMAQSDRSMMAGVKNIDKTIAMVKKHMAGSKRRAR